MLYIQAAKEQSAHIFSCDCLVDFKSTSLFTHIELRYCDIGCSFAIGCLNLANNLFLTVFTKKLI